MLLLPPGWNATGVASRRMNRMSTGVLYKAENGYITYLQKAAQFRTVSYINITNSMEKSPS
jgi:hypothetical protein